ncbi:alpha-L-rhamnosidase [Arenibacter sp. TNZ]|uniref:family 78 glycoside hydrolase catalytic domain n=1 Tax=Arenibacter TaxID=178469 RepID=UPI000CD447B9|nr:MULTISPECIES: family 78 glycoside hydrolase catalytic domain [Arenibacter]MCM4170782.1 alpha-L-rhamnosidase [Arenibacter sp. TNZ]
MKQKAPILLMLLLSISINAQITVGTAYCENKINPLGVPLENLIFSWELRSEQKSVFQTAYQLVISTTADKLDSNKFDVYDSGVKKGSQSIQIQFPGKTLEPSQTYHWKVKVWNNKDNSFKWSGNQYFTTGLFSDNDWKNAKWIGYEHFLDSQRVVPFVHGKMDADNPKVISNAVSPLFRKEFVATKKIQKALFFISGLGHYEASINGSKIGNSFLAPGWTNYDKTVLYNSYDITHQLQNGRNTLGITLGNGFYNVSQERYVKGTGAFGNPKMIGLLKIEYTDGTIDFIVSDDTWKTSPSPITFNTIFGGEDYDARLEQKGWNMNSFDDKVWRQAVLVKPPLGELLPEMDYPVQLVDTLKAVGLEELEKGISVYDFNQDASGILKIKVRGKAGQTIKLTPGEILFKNGAVDQRIAPNHTYSYTLKGDGEEIWQPKFSYYALRYVQVSREAGHISNGESTLPELLDIELLHNRNSTPENGSFSCSNELFNRIYSLIDWAIKSNLQSYITDNPQREKLSWQGEQNFMRKSINYAYEVQNLYHSLVQNIMDTQYDNGLVPDTVPEYIKFDGPFVDSPEWGTTAILNMWFLYKYYGDTRTMKKAYPMMVKYAKYLEGKAEGNLLTYGLGDWLDVGPNHKSPANLTPMGLTATAYYYYAIHSLGKMAGLIENTQDETYYMDLAKNIRDSFNENFFDKETKVYATGSQTAMAMPISMDIVEPEYKAIVLKNLVNSITAYGKMLTTGDVGHRYLVDALYKNNEQQLLFDMTNRDDVPGYGYQLKKGATSLIETWDGNESWNQLAMGHIFEWFYGGIAGISQEDNSIAYNHIRIEPQPVQGISSAKGSFHSPYGWIKTDWIKNEVQFLLKLEIPVNTKATVYLKVAPSEKLFVNGDPVDYKIMDANKIYFDLGSGHYEVIVK